MSTYSQQFTDPRHPWPTLGRFHWLWVAVLAVACAIASIHPLDFSSYLMHQAGTVLFLGAMLAFVHIGKISRLGFALGIVFLLLHVSAAHYLYSYVPYNEWSKAVLGWDINKTFGWQRNMYDRLVHLGYGLLLYKLILDIFGTWFPQSPRGRVALLVLQFIMASSLVYEFIEWGIAMTMSPEAAEQYNGQQGDQWDAHKDMAMATLGALLAWVIDRFYSALKPSSQRILPR